jgi:Putative enzyme of poly-gamma-glutamate biosynthesis (capsule formation)
MFFYRRERKEGAMDTKNYSFLVSVALSLRLIFFFLYISTLSFSQELTFLFAGDAMQHQSQIGNAFRNGSYDYSSYFPYIEYEVSQADLAFVNLETTLAGKPYRGYPSFSAPDKYAIALQKAGFDVFLTANNHILDKGNRGTLRTLSILDSIGVEHTGSFRDESERNRKYPLFIEKNGFRLAILNYTYGTNGLTARFPLIVNYIDKEIIRDDIKKARDHNADVIIANMHWGDEYKLLPNKRQEDLASFLVEEGVDLIIGSHPHVVQPSRLLKDESGNFRHLIVFSLGNLISGMKAINTDGGQLVKVTIQKQDDRIFIKSAGYILVYKHQQIKEGKTDFQVIPVSLFEMPDYSREEYKINLDENAQKKLALFSRNARMVLNKHNQSVPEYRIRVAHSNEKIPTEFVKPFFVNQKNIVPLPRK